MFTRVLFILFLAASMVGQSTTEATSNKAAHYPRLTRAELPLYPPLPWTAHISGTVEIQVTVEKGKVVDAQVKSGSTGNQILLLASAENVKTWQFQSEDRATFLVTYVYKIEGDETELPENPKVELDLPRLLKVTARPFKPTCNDCIPQAKTPITHRDTPTMH